jgi:hypothetical protein
MPFHGVYQCRFEVRARDPFKIHVVFVLADAYALTISLSLNISRINELRWSATAKGTTKRLVTLTSALVIYMHMYINSTYKNVITICTSQARTQGGGSLGSCEPPFVP